MKKRQWIILLIGAGILLLSYGLNQLFVSLKEEPEKKKPPTTKKYVDTERVSYSDIQTYINAFGRVQAAQSLDLISEVSGRMYRGTIRLKEGERFQKGNLLFYIDNKEASLSLKAEKSNFLRDIAGILPEIKIDHAQDFSKWKDYFEQVDIDGDLDEMPEPSNDKIRTFLATRGIYSTYYRIKSTEERLKKYRYYAPFAGSISSVALESGAFVNPGTRIGTVMRSDNHELKIAVETKDIPWVQLGSEVQVYSEETQQKWQGEVTRISDFVNQNTQSVDVFVAIQPGAGKIYDGQFIKATIPARTVQDGMAIPRNAIYNANEVFVIQDTLLKRKEVFVHRVMDKDVIISGLDEGIDLVIEPLLGAHNDMIVYKSDKQEVRARGSVSGQLETKQ